ncbi:hypothetical protein [Clostridium sp.]|uniref:hypothetical protein n=1 Tax=Clostridium sp. TaxID=1506 RepID=UPI0025B8DFBC|nr:hypothetical protein [Clostridium sp.]
MVQKLNDVFKLDILNNPLYVKRLYQILDRYTLTKEEKKEFYLSLKGLFEDMAKLEKELADNEAQKLANTEEAKVD